MCPEAVAASNEPKVWSHFMLYLVSMIGLSRYWTFGHLNNNLNICSDFPGLRAGAAPSLRHLRVSESEVRILPLDHGSCPLQCGQRWKCRGIERWAKFSVCSEAVNEISWTFINIRRRYRPCLMPCIVSQYILQHHSFNTCRCFQQGGILWKMFANFCWQL